jgi:hypothetical protein
MATYSFRQSVFEEKPPEFFNVSLSLLIYLLENASVV